MVRKVLIIGATSAIAEATARLFAERGDSLFLVARDATRVANVADDLRVRGAARVETRTLDTTNFALQRNVLDTAHEAFDGIDVALVAHGSLPDQAACEQNIDKLRHEFDTNAVSTVAILGDLANRMERQGHGTLAVISSVAGDRGRQSNYVYGAAKAAVSTFASGLRQRLAKSSVCVLTIKPGFVDSPMTAGFENKGILWAQPEHIARGIVAAIDARRNTVYLPWFWRWIMLIIRQIPEPLFKRLKL